MRHAFIDRYSRLSSPIHRAPILLKVLVMIALLCITVSVPISPEAACLLIAGVVAIALVSRIPPLFLVRRMLFLEIFVVGIALLSLFQSNGMAIFGTILVKSTICLSTVVLFSNTTQFADLLRMFRRWGLPDLMISMFALMYRYVFVMIDEMERMHRARVSRTFEKTRWVEWRALSTVVAQLFIRSTERAERIYAAMCARGWK